MLKKTTATQPMGECDIGQLGIKEIELLCEDLAPKSKDELKHQRILQTGTAEIFRQPLFTPLLPVMD